MSNPSISNLSPSPIIQLSDNQFFSILCLCCGLTILFAPLFIGFEIEEILSLAFE